MMYPTDDLPSLVLPPIEYPEVLPKSAQKININDKILDLYKNTILPGEFEVDLYIMASGFLRNDCLVTATVEYWIYN